MVITISRETGSGGHTIGKLLAEKLGYAFYDKEIVASAARAMGIDEKFILENGENMSDQDYIDMKSGFIPHCKKQEVPYEEIREAQDRVIKNISEIVSSWGEGRTTSCAAGKMYSTSLSTRVWSIV